MSNYNSACMAPKSICANTDGGADNKWYRVGDNWTQHEWISRFDTFLLNVSLPQHDTFLGHICVNSKARHISWRTPALPQQKNKKKTHNACRNQSLIPKVNYNLRIWYKMSNIWTGYSLGIENWFDWCFWCEFVPWNHTNENNASHWIKEVLINMYTAYNSAWGILAHRWYPCGDESTMPWMRHGRVSKAEVMQL